MRVPRLDGDDCQVWWAPAGDVVPDDSVLDAAERERMARFVHDADRIRYAAAHTLARVVLGAHLGVPPGSVGFQAVCRRCGGAHGKPFVAGGPEFSLTHGGDLVAVAVTRAGPVGVDVEPVARTLEPGLAATVLAAEEPYGGHPADLIRYWARKEAVLKATGDGLAVPPSSVVVTPPGAAPRVLASPADGPVQLADLDLPPAYAGAVAVLAAQPPRIVLLHG